LGYQRNFNVGPVAQEFLQMQRRVGASKTAAQN
jgi:hypothetical protein